MIRKPVLLAVDDEPGMLALVERFAGPAGALVDLRMPEVGGLEVLRAIRSAQPQCQVILMTAHAEVDSAIEAVKLGALDYLTKPLDFARLRQLLRQATDDLTPP